MLASLLAGMSSPQRLRSVLRFVPGVAASTGTLDELVDRMLDARLGDPHPEPRDLLDRLITGEHGLTRDEIRDELLTLVLAGHETTANTLTWTLVLLSRYPAARERLVDEVDAVLGGRDAEAADVDALPWTRAVVDEAMRLYPPAWTIERDAVVDDDVAGVPVRAGDTVAVSPWLLHRNPDVWPNPEGFDPSRFLPGADRPRHAFVPFGGGRRICVGAGLAQLEAVLALATFAATHRLDLVPGSQVRTQAGVTLHPRGAVPMTTLPRVSAPLPVG